MDRKIEKKKWNSKLLMTIGGVVVLVGGIVYVVLATSGKSKLNVDRERITISEVTKGPFQVTIPENGVVLPITTIYVDAAEGGRVQERFVEDGTMVKKGDPILKLGNSDLELSLSNQETQVFGQITQMQISRNNARQATIGKLNQMADVDNGFREAERIYKLNKRLYDQKAIGLQEFKKSENDYNYQLNRKKLTTQILSSDSSQVRTEEKQNQEQYAHMKNSLAMMRKKVDDLTIRAPVDGQLTGMDAEIGQNKAKGASIGQIDVITGFKVRVNIDEHYLQQVFLGIPGTFALGDKQFKLVVKKVYAQITNGKFQVDMQFVDKVPAGIRRGQTLQILLALSDETQAVLVPRGGFYQATGGNWIFKLSADGKTAYRADIQLSRQNPDFFEVLGGLKPGEKVITSSYDTYGDIQELIIK
ncbi:efflux RND transporter periplasmic adaptor subunit [Mucilaginibacter myungsuensis]|uniref:Efflux transporter periplasmic adaptor subunit n=1 Tax=Mucilaginibacter myungsuensis TaxID=649104 RepID=A0A929PVZ2_9SPHI|nr:HlyD family efflux transporter periplasmic adaptor subunit [Mucilaginibacter myungsuensis]MBE9660607.1 efflux transporter periplasmic adaptor subunit [Mucilaginibacter myungsuensis]MDN3600652.1 HlyD family efflux transporter periplasmic adaptor subunit [Mucilaginibacter myungsuensis]